MAGQWPGKFEKLKINDFGSFQKIHLFYSRGMDKIRVKSYLLVIHPRQFHQDQR